jgi:hypothetical protein
MKGRRLLALAVLAFAFACDQKAPTDPAGLKAPSDPSMIISDGAHGGNPDFFFLPPLLPNPSNSPNYESGRANTTLASSLTVEICELQAAPVNAQGLPVATDCIAGPPLKKFPAGTVRLADSGNDGFYMAQWKPTESNLVLSKYYRIKVLIEGSTAPLGAADLDPVANQKELKNVRTGEVIPLTADGTLPIKFRVENGGGPPVCGPAVLCTSTVVTNNSPTGSTIVTVDGGSGAVAGAKFPNGWLPAGGPQSVLVTIASVNTGVSNPATGTETIPCHAGVSLQQFRGCFNFTTTPRLAPIDESGAQFAIPVTVAVCYVLQGTGDPREKFAEMWASGPNEPAHPLPDASDVGILSANTRDCSNNVIGLNNSKGITGFASAGWQKLKGGLGSFFGVKTAYAVDIGLGGFLSEFSNVGPVLSAEMDPVGSTEMTVPGGGVVQPSVRIVGSNHHDGEHHNETGLGGLSVTWVASAGTVSIPGVQGGTTQLTNTTNTLPISPQDPQSGGGFAGVNWAVPSTPGTYTLTATGPATGGPLTWTAIVPAGPPPNVIGLGPTERRMLSMQTGSSIQVGVTGDNAIAVWSSSAANKVTVSATGLVTAIVGGESIEGGDSSFVSSILTTQNPGPSVVVDSYTFNLFPRTTTLVWNAVEGAASYQVVTEFGNGSETNPFCTVPAECGVWTQQVAGSTTANALMFTFDFVGAQPGRWRVSALNAAGGVISTSPFVYFAYSI